MKIAIIGAGLSGCNAYLNLKKQNHDIVIFEKSRGTGGRLSTKYIDDKFIDHGTPFINTKDYTFPNFLDFLDKKVNENVLKNINKNYYSTNGINKLCSSLINKKNLLTNTKIVNASLNNNKWTLVDEDNNTYEDFDFLVLTIPATQILENNFDLDEATKKQLENVLYESIATLICYKNTDKKDKENFKTIEHFWKFAFVKEGIRKDFILNEEKSYGICGDYFNGVNLEASYQSSLKIADEINSIYKKDTKC